MPMWQTCSSLLLVANPFPAARHSTHSCRGDSTTQILASQFKQIQKSKIKLVESRIRHRGVAATWSGVKGKVARSCDPKCFRVRCFRKGWGGARHPRLDKFHHITITITVAITSTWRVE